MIKPGRYAVACAKGDRYEQEVRAGVTQYEICGACGAPATFLPIEEAAPIDHVVGALRAALLARDPDRLASLSGRTDNTEQLDDGSLLRVVRTRRGFRIEHVTRSGDAPPEQAWEVDEHGRAIR